MFPDKNKKILPTKSGMQIWINSEQESKIQTCISRGANALELDGRTVMVSDISGIYLPEDVADKNKKELSEKSKLEKEKADVEAKNALAKQAMDSCTKCNRKGWIEERVGLGFESRKCDCLASVFGYGLPKSSKN